MESMTGCWEFISIPGRGPCGIGKKAPWFPDEQFIMNCVGSLEANGIKILVPVLLVIADIGAVVTLETARELRSLNPICASSNSKTQAMGFPMTNLIVLRRWSGPFCGR